MANEITVAASLAFAKGAIASKSLAISSRFNVAGSGYVEGTQSIPTTAGGTALELGKIGTLGLAAIKNTDATHFVQLMDGVSGALIAKLLPGEMWLGRFPVGATAPAAIADTAAVIIEFLIIEN